MIYTPVMSAGHPARPHARLSLPFGKRVRDGTAMEWLTGGSCHPMMRLALSMRHTAPNRVGELGSIRKSTTRILFEGTRDDPA